MLPMKKYNIALLPVDSQRLIAYAQRFSIINPIYILGAKSLPHVTLCQFYREESEIEAIWGEVCAALSNDALDLEFKNFSLITFDNKMFWISLMPSDAPKLHRIQADVASILKITNKKPYDPHLTLIGTLDSTYETQAAPLIAEYKPIPDKFVLALGECDEIGQFVRIIHQKDPTEAAALRK